MPTARDIQAAIAVVDDSRQTHVAWRDYYRQYPAAAAVKAYVELAGDEARHVAKIADYDQVLAVLKACLDEKGGIP